MGAHQEVETMSAFWLEVNETGCVIFESLQAVGIFLGNAI